MQSERINSDSSYSTNPSSVPTMHQQPKLPLEERLVKNRLGIYSALFMALRAKHPPTAAHSLRVALGCSKWAMLRRMNETDRELLEIAALLHDLGKIGVPDHVLHKPDALLGSEQSLMQLHIDLAIELLTNAGASANLLDIIRCYRPQENSCSPNASANIRTSARMLSIVDAFDSMTSEQPFRRALPRDVAIQELLKNAANQFDPVLAAEFGKIAALPASEIDALVGRRWLNELSPYPTSGFCDTSMPASGAVQNLIDTLYHHRLLEAMSDAAIYFDCSGSILTWNRAAEKLTGRTAAVMLHQTLSAELIGLTTIGGGKLVEDRCPITRALQGNATEHHKFLLRNMDGQELPVSLNTLLVRNSKNQLCGAIVMIRDASHQVELEEQVQSLHEIATTDNLTTVSNRAELSRCLPEFVSSHLATSQAASLIICDIDHFKRINDTYGHPAGDEALVVFARVLKQMARAGDVVARFGGEEFVILCSNCNITAATSRAESIRRAIEVTPVQGLRNQCMTVSFGVTELQAGDNHETLLARADRALLMAKDSGRNRVIQIGQEETATSEPEKRNSWFNWFSAAEHKTPVLERDFITAVPQEMAIERLGGFINDHKAEIIKVDDNRVAIRINSGQLAANRRANDRPIDLLMEIKMEEVELRAASQRGNSSTQTRLRVSFRPTKNRDRRIVNIAEQANQLICGFRSYLVAQDLTEDLLNLIVSSPTK